MGFRHFYNTSQKKVKKKRLILPRFQEFTYHIAFIKFLSFYVIGESFANCFFIVKETLISSNLLLQKPHHGVMRTK